MTEQLTLYEENGTLYAGSIGETTPVSWQGDANLSFEEWEAIGRTLNQIGASLNWWVGDWLNYGERKWGEMYAQAIEVTGWDYQRLAQAKRVASKVNFSTRVEKLTWTHHREVEDLPEPEQAQWLKRAVAEHMSTRELRDAIKASQQPAQLPPTIPHTNGHTLPEDDGDDVPFSFERNGDGEPDGDTNGFLGTRQIVRNGMGDYYVLNNGVKQCAQCAQLWAADMDYCPYCHISPEARMHYTNQERTKLPLAASNHAVSSDPNYDGDEWYTPTEYIEAARRVMGGIDLDPASCDEAQQVVNAGAFYTKEDDSLRPEVDWSGRVWLNPPYSTPLIQHFVERIIAEYETGNVTEAILLTNNSSDTKWFHSLIEKYPACFTRGRVQFWRSDHQAFGARQGQTLFYLGANVRAFAREFSSLGVVVERVH